MGLWLMLMLGDGGAYGWYVAAITPPTRKGLPLSQRVLVQIAEEPSHSLYVLISLATAIGAKYPRKVNVTSRFWLLADDAS